MTRPTMTVLFVVELNICAMKDDGKRTAVTVHGVVHSIKGLPVALGLGLAAGSIDIECRSARRTPTLGRWYPLEFSLTILKRKQR